MYMILDKLSIVKFKSFNQECAQKKHLNLMWGGWGVFGIQVYICLSFFLHGRVL